MQPLLILTTGGTIDKIYFDAKSTYEVGPPSVERLLPELNLAVSYRIKSLMRKDSLELTDDDRSLIRDAVLQSEETGIIITHGTDTMVETARSLLAVTGKTIVLTGALEPALFSSSDALFNMGSGMAAAQILPPGIYIAMSGTVFDATNVRKNLQKNRFEELR